MIETPNPGRRCSNYVRRGGPSSGGGYDRLNLTRDERCDRPTDGGPYCARCTKTVARQQARAEQRAERRRAQA